MYLQQIHLVVTNEVSYFEIRDRELLTITLKDGLRKEKKTGMKDMKERERKTKEKEIEKGNRGKVRIQSNKTPSVELKESRSGKTSFKIIGCLVLALS